MTEQMTKNFEQFADMFKAAMPKVQTNKNGYEIRTKVLEFAQNNVWQDYHAKWGQYETTVKKDGDEVVKVLEAANMFYDFVSGTKK